MRRSVSDPCWDPVGRRRSKLFERRDDVRTTDEGFALSQAVGPGSSRISNIAATLFTCLFRAVKLGWPKFDSKLADILD